MFSIELRLRVSIDINGNKQKKRKQRKETNNSTSRADGKDCRRLADAGEKVIGVLQKVRSRSTTANYLMALHALLAYAGSDIRVGDIDRHQIEGFQRWLQNRGVKPNTTSCYMRSLRTLLKNISSSTDWQQVFSSVFTGNARTDKRAATQEDIGKLQNISQPLSQRMCFVRDMFLFCLYALGMPFVDLAFLRRSQVKDGYIEYCRHKTGQPVRVKIEQPMQEIMDRWSAQDGDYVFPILKQTDPQKAMEEYERMRGRYNRRLSQLAKLAGTEHLTSYVARHSWASMAYQQNIDLPVIAKALGHTNTQTTLIYIRDIDDHRIDDAGAIVANAISTEGYSHSMDAEGIPCVRTLSR